MMDTKEALKELEDLTVDYGNRNEEQIARLDEAIDMAMDALRNLPSAQPVKRTEERTETHACDLISRSDAIGAVKEERFPIDSDYAEGFMAALDKVEWILKEWLPSAQPEIIRCKECKHQVKEWRTDKRLKDNGYMVCGCDVVGDACGYWALLGQDDDFCSKAERRTDDR